MLSGERVLHHGDAWHELSRFVVCQVSGQQCEACETPHPLPWPRGQAHHYYGRGGGRRTDLVFVAMQTIETQPNLALWRWYRNLIWVCAKGHVRIEGMSSAEFRQGLKRYCECGLLRFFLPVENVTCFNIDTRNFKSQEVSECQ